MNDLLSFGSVVDLVQIDSNNIVLSFRLLTSYHRVPGLGEVWHILLIVQGLHADL